MSIDDLRLRAKTPIPLTPMPASGATRLQKLRPGRFLNLLPSGLRSEILMDRERVRRVSQGR